MPCLYELFGVERDATAAQIRKAYLLKSRELHPDKQQDPKLKEAAKQAFQDLTAAHDVLKDEKKRARYDKTGKVGDDDFEAAYENLRTFFPHIEKADIEAFEAKYKGSEEEVEDVRDILRKGELPHFFEVMMLSRSDELQRFEQILKKLFKAEPKLFKQPLKESLALLKKDCARCAKQEQKDAKALAKEEAKAKKQAKTPSKPSIDDLALMIQARQAERAAGAMSFLDGLAAKYGTPEKGTPGKAKRGAKPAQEAPKAKRPRKA